MLYTLPEKKSNKWTKEYDRGHNDGYNAALKDIKNIDKMDMKVLKIEKEMIGKTFGRLKVESYEGRNRDYVLLFKCVCECSRVVVVKKTSLTSGKTHSCGCLHLEKTTSENKTHGMSNTRLYRILVGMKQRCYKKNRKSYPYYGGRGITICNEWLNDFMKFYHWAMSNGYKEDLTIDRIDNDGNYEPSNCRWATKTQQCQNQRNHRPNTLTVEVED